MNDDELRANILETLGMTDAGKDVQEEALYRVQSIADKRLALAIPEMLSKEQLTTLEDMYDANKNDDEIVAWAQDQLPQFEDMVHAIMLDVADEVVAATGGSN